jgi:hypothetical protein
MRETAVTSAAVGALRSEYTAIVVTMPMRKLIATVNASGVS